MVRAELKPTRSLGEQPWGGGGGRGDLGGQGFCSGPVWATVPGLGPLGLLPAVPRLRDWSGNVPQTRVGLSKLGHNQGMKNILPWLLLAMGAGGGDS